MRRQPVAEVALGEQHRRPRVVDHEGEALGRIAGVERHVDAAGLDHRQHRHHHLQRALQDQRHPHLRPDAEGGEAARQVLGAAVELAVGQAPVAADHRLGLRRRRRLLGEEVGQAGLPRVGVDRGRWRPRR